jgi:microcystin-dependent protein
MAKNNNFNSIGQAPIGSIVRFDFTALDGWLLCDGSTLATANYPELFGVIGYTYGGSGADFDLPTVADYLIRSV